MPPLRVVDSALLAAKIAAVRDATDRVRTVLPATVDAFTADGTAREVVTLDWRRVYALAASGLEIRTPLCQARSAST